MANIVPHGQSPFNVTHAMVLAKAMAGSGFFQDVRDANKALTKIVIGHELGFGPAASLTGIHLISGKPVLSANMIAALIRRSGRYDYQVVQLENKSCSIRFLTRGDDGKSWKELGVSSFTEADAKAAGLANKPVWQQYGRNMYFSRALTNGARWYTPDLLAGSPIYTPEELGADVDEDGDIITVQTSVIPADPSELRDLIQSSGVEEKVALEYIGVTRAEDATPDDVEKLRSFVNLKSKSKMKKS